jgi:predicted nucleic acid-binding protein
MECINYLVKICTIQDFTKEIIQTASSVREKYSLSFWDSVIVSSALCSNCDILISEDMQDGLIINDKLKIRNILK